MEAGLEKYILPSSEYLSMIHRQTTNRCIIIRKLLQRELNLLTTFSSSSSSSSFFFLLLLFLSVFGKRCFTV